MSNPIRTPNIAKIENFREVFDWISYDMSHTTYTLNKDRNGIFYIDKLVIEPKYLIYKMECAELADGLYEKVEVLYKLLGS